MARDERKLEEVAAECRTLGAVVETAAVDVRDRESMADCIRQMDAANPVDLVIANAGVSSSIGADGSPEPPDLAQATFDINLIGAVNTISPLIEPMCQRGGGHIATICSLAALFPFPSTPSYSASKAALAFWARALGLAYADQGLRVTVVHPGFVETDMSDRVVGPRSMMLSAQKAAARIHRALDQGRKTFAFPILLRWGIACLNLLPFALTKDLMGLFNYTVWWDNEP